jgi:hypothetical protein
MTFLIVVAALAYSGTKIAAAVREADLLRNNPEAYKALKESQAADRERRREGAGKAALAAVRLGRLFFRK